MSQPQFYHSQTKGHRPATMFGAHKAAKRFSLLLLEEGEDYVEDWVCEARWPANVSGNWQGLPKLQGRLRLCSKSLFFEPDDVRIPIVRCAHPQLLMDKRYPCARHTKQACPAHESWPLVFIRQQHPAPAVLHWPRPA